MNAVGVSNNSNGNYGGPGRSKHSCEEETEGSEETVIFPGARRPQQVFSCPVSVIAVTRASTCKQKCEEFLISNSVQL